jgi:hypothetical protein
VINITSLTILSAARGVGISVAGPSNPQQSHLQKTRIRVLLLRANDLCFGAMCSTERE